MGLLADDMNAYVMGFFLSLSLINVWENSGTFFRRKKKLDALQWVASVAQITNLTLHMILNTAKGLPCFAMAWIETSCYYVLQLGSAYVIIYRATALVDNRHYRYLVRVVLGLLQGCSLGFNLASIILMDNEDVDGTCTPIYDRKYNDTCKIFLAVLYIGLLVAFCVPVVKNIRTSQKFIKKSTFRDVATITAIKIMLAIFGEILTAILSLAGVFGEYFWIQFSIQNYSLVWASTVASRRSSNDINASLILTSQNRKAESSRSNSDKALVQVDTQSV